MERTEERQLARIPASERILLMPHCLRRSATCQGKYDEWGLRCQQCDPDCAINCLSRAALELGYRGVCVAPGGRLAVKYVKESRPRAIVAVACQQELEEGIQSVKGLSGCSGDVPSIVVIPLSRDGCIDTEVDIESALEVISLGCRVEIGAAVRSVRR